MKDRMGLNKKPNLSDILEWGARVWVHKKDCSKLDPCADPVQWVGYDEDSCGHHIYWLEKRRATVERSIVFEGEGSVSPGAASDPEGATNHPRSEVIIDIPQAEDTETHQEGNSQKDPSNQPRDPIPQVQALPTLPN